MSSPLAITLQQIVECFALHALWQIPLLAGAAWCALGLGKPHVRVAYTVWYGTLLLSLLLPVCATIAAQAAALRAQRARADVTLDVLPYAGTLPAFQRESRWAWFVHQHFSLREGFQPVALTVPASWARRISLTFLATLLLSTARLIVS